MFHRCTALTALCLVICVSAFGQDAIDTDTRTKIKALVEQLSAPSQRERQAAQDALLDVGPDAEDYLRAERLNPELGFEQKRRIDWLLERISTPEFALIWRGQAKVKTPQGLTYGSLVIGVNGREFASSEDIQAFWRIEGEVRLRLWVYGKDPVWVKTTLSQEQLRGFNPYPDLLHKYDKHGHRGDWDFKVRHGLQLSRNLSNPASIEDFEAAWEMGCRDALMLHAWAAVLRGAERYDDALTLLDEKAPQAIASYPGGTYAQGKLPAERVKTLMATGRFDEAASALEQALAAAREAKAHDGAITLLQEQVVLIRHVAPEDLFAFMKKHSELGLEQLPPPRLLHYADDITAGMSDPAEGLAFLKYIRKQADEKGGYAQPDVLRRLERHYEQQRELAREWKTDRPHRTLIRYDHEGSILYGPLDHRTPETILSPLTLPGSFEATLAPLPLGAWTAQQPYFALTLRTKCSPDCGCYAHEDSYVNLLTYGACRYMPTIRDHATGLNIMTTAYYDSARPQTIRIDVEPGRRRLYTAGKLRREWYGNVEPDTRFGPLRPAISASRRNGRMQDAKWFVFSKAQADNAAIQETLLAIDQAGREGDLPKIETLYKELFALWKDIPQADDAIAEHAQKLEFYRQAMSEDGLDLNNMDLLNHPQTLKDDTARWIVAGEWLCGYNPYFTTSDLCFPVPLPENIEITGLLRINGFAKGTYGFFFVPNANESKTALMFYGGLQAGWSPQIKQFMAFSGNFGDGPRVTRDDYQPGKTFAFCIRFKGDQVAMFVDDPDKPILTHKGPRGQGSRLALNVSCFPRNPVYFGKLHVRTIAEDVKLDAPATLPDIIEAPTLNAQDMLTAAGLTTENNSAFPPVLTLEEVEALIEKRKAPEDETQDEPESEADGPKADDPTKRQANDF